jgi:hypothetical protein
MSFSAAPALKDAAMPSPVAQLGFVLFLYTLPMPPVAMMIFSGCEKLYICRQTRQRPPLRRRLRSGIDDAGVVGECDIVLFLRDLHKLLVRWKPWRPRRSAESC